MPSARAAIDYDLAVRTAARLAPAGPQLTRPEADAVVAELRELAVSAEQHVRDVTGLVPPGEPEPATVVDRRGWAQANVDGFRVVLDPLTHRLLDTQRSAIALRATATAAGLQMGGVLSFLSSRVLGQYEAFTASGTPGRLLLVAPNIVETERRLGVDPHDFRLWVTLHEVTHRTQFTAVPWLHDHVRSEIDALLSASSLDDPSALLARARDVVRRAPGAVREGGSLAALLQSPEQQEVLERVTAFMSLLEGHAEHVMDGVARRSSRASRSSGVASTSDAASAVAWSTGCCGTCSDWTSRPCSTPRARPSSTPPWPPWA